MEIGRAIADAKEIFYRLHRHPELSSAIKYWSCRTFGMLATFVILVVIVQSVQTLVNYFAKRARNH